MLEKLNADFYHAKQKDGLIVTALKLLDADKTILDIGAGQMPYKKYCRHLKYVSQDFCKYDGEGDGKGIQTVTFNTDQIDIACDITNIPVESSSFDAILCTEVLEHVIEPNSAIKEMTRILKPGGVLIITVPGTSLLHFSPYHYFTGFKCNYFYELLSEKNFKDLSVVRVGNIYTISALYVWYIVEKISKSILPRMNKLLFKFLIMGTSPFVLMLLLLGRMSKIDPETIEAGVFVIGTKKCES